MRIRLRPYHPTCVVRYFGCLDLTVEDMRKAFWGNQLTTFAEKAYNEDGFNYVLDRMKSNPREVEIELVEEYDDICVRCNRRVRDEKGSVWGKAHSCSSSRNPQIVEGVNKQNREVLQKLGLEFGSVIGLEYLLKLLSERIPRVGNPEDQKSYEKGFEVLRALLKEFNA